MDQWYFAKDGQQNGPVTLEQVRELARNGGITRTSQVWNESMKDWTAAGEVPGIFEVAAPVYPVASAGPAPDPSNPYAAPQSSWLAPEPAMGESLAEIVPGSEPLDPAACIKRGFEIAKRNVGTVALTIIVYYAITYGISIISQVLQVAASGGLPSASSSSISTSSSTAGAGVAVWMSVGFGIAEQLVSVFLGLGLTRVWLNLVSGKPATVGMIFGEGGKLLRAVLASILFGLAVGIGVVLLIFPGIYIALRYGQFLTAIVDRDMGIMESFNYSSTLTTNNRGAIFLLGVLSFLVIIAGLIALCVGMFVAIPIVWLAAAVAYRWMQYGHRAVMDHPGTQRPLLAND